MTIYSVYIINKAGGLNFSVDYSQPKEEVEKTFSYPLDIHLKQQDKRIVVEFGERDGIRVGHSVIAVNGAPVDGSVLDDGRSVLDVVKDANSYPISIKFGRPPLSPNERLVLASMFHSLFAIGCQISPVAKSSGIQMIETDTFRIHCYQTTTGIKFVAITDLKQGQVESFLKKVYELYTDFALKNPFYSLDMPIRSALFDQNLQSLLESGDRVAGTVG